MTPSPEKRSHCASCSFQGFPNHSPLGATWSPRLGAFEWRAQHSLSESETLCPVLLLAALAFELGSSCQTELCLVGFQALLCPLVVLAQPDWH